MEKTFTADERRRIEAGIGEKYRKVALSPEGSFNYPTGRAGLEGLGYPPEILEPLPEDVLASYCGVGNPFSLGPIGKSERVLDIGCGAGVDTIVAAVMTGPEGGAVGIEFTPEMLERAKENLRKTSLENVTFERGSAEALPFPDSYFDVVISNGVFNLVPDKRQALKEAFRVLKSNGRFMIADQVLTAESRPDAGSMVETWAG